MFYRRTRLSSGAFSCNLQENALLGGSVLLYFTGERASRRERSPVIYRRTRFSVGAFSCNLQENALLNESVLL